MDLSQILLPPVPLEQLPMQEMTITYMRGDKVDMKFIKGKLLYYASTGHFGPNTYIPSELTNIFGNRDGHEPLFTVATKHIITIEIKSYDTSH
jgi:hypothetical protein